MQYPLTLVLNCSSFGFNWFSFNINITADTRQSWSRMDLLTNGLESFEDAKHTCVITCPSDDRKLQYGDKILVLRPWERTPAGLKLGKYSTENSDKTQWKPRKEGSLSSIDGVHDQSNDVIIDDLDLMSSFEINGK